MRVRIKGFRCFRDTGDVDVTPVTFLVGENSVGKTAFLAMYYYMTRWMSGERETSFNDPPFEMGAFEQIAHYRGGRGSQENSFSFQIERRAGAPFKIFASFENFSGYAYIRSVTLDYSYFKIKCKIVKSKLSIKFYADKTDPITIDASYPMMESTNSIDIFLLHRALRDVVDNEDIISFFKSKINGDKKKQSEILGIQKIRNHMSMRMNLKYGILDTLRSPIISDRNFPFCFAPIRTKPYRTYHHTDSARWNVEGDNIPQLIARTKMIEKEKWENFKNSLEDFGQKSGLFSKIDIRSLGKETSDPFQIRIGFKGIANRNLTDVGYGVNQSLPIITQILLSKPRSAFLIQQPEVHLHPKAQAELGSLIYKIHKERNTHFVIETHSDHIIDRFMSEIKNGKENPKEFSIIYMERDRTQMESAVHQINFDKNANLKGAPKGYRDFFLAEEKKLLGIDD